MGPRWRLICVGWLSGASPVSYLQQTHHLVGFLHLELGHTWELDAFVGVVSQVEVGVFAVGDEEVSDYFIVDFNEGHLYFKLLFRHILNLLEHASNNQEHNSRFFNCPRHSVCLSTSSRAICKYAAIVPLYNRADQAFTCVVIDCLCVSGLREDPIEVVSLFLRPVEHLRLLTLVFILHVHFVKNNLYIVSVNIYFTSSLSSVLMMSMSWRETSL